MGLHYDNGQVQIDNKPRESVRSVACSRVVRWVSHPPFVCKLNAAAAIPIYEALGGRDVRYETIACVSEGGVHCEWLVHWSDDE